MCGYVSFLPGARLAYVVGLGAPPLFTGGLAAPLVAHLRRFRGGAVSLLAALLPVRARSLSALSGYSSGLSSSHRLMDGSPRQYPRVAIALCLGAPVGGICYCTWSRRTPGRPALRGSGRRTPGTSSRNLSFGGSAPGGRSCSTACGRRWCPGRSSACSSWLGSCGRAGLSLAT